MFMDRGAGFPPGVGLEYLPPLPHRPAAGLQHQGINHENKKLPSSFTSKRNFVFWLIWGPARPCGWTLGPCRHVLCMCLSVLMCADAKARPCTLGTQMVSPTGWGKEISPRWWEKSGPEEQGLGNPVAGAHGSLRKPWAC